MATSTITDFCTFNGSLINCEERYLGARPDKHLNAIYNHGVKVTLGKD